MNPDSESDVSNITPPHIWESESIRRASHSDSSLKFRERRKKNIFGTDERSIHWFNTDDWCGLATAILVYAMIIYANYIAIYLCLVVGVYNWFNIVLFCFLSFMAMWCHFNTMVTDPGSVPHSARVISNDSRADDTITMCAKCDSFKPPRAHHCRVCGRCIVRMDHHCPWVNNCIGALNQKMFILFLVYIQCLSVYGFVLCTYYFIVCDLTDRICIESTSYSVAFVPSLLVMSLGSGMFTLAMLFNQTTSVIKGLGTVDRIQRRRKKLVGKYEISREESAFRWKRIFGSRPKWSYFFPTRPKYTAKDKAILLGFVVPGDNTARSSNSRILI
mmetsp:Transcript_2506/g.3686  ORF Transcript_2506/g.3686 Transcript_2506/m.3686 type:complete len:331 (-) Transcript_2506:183-1175(-)